MNIVNGQKRYIMMALAATACAITIVRAGHQVPMESNATATAHAVGGSTQGKNRS